jgi:hypothetical protein
VLEYDEWQHFVKRKSKAVALDRTSNARFDRQVRNQPENP